MNKFLLHSIESFPPLRESIHKLNKLYSANEIDSKAIELVIESDPILYTNILHYANSPQYSFRRSISNISQVISLFGHTTLQGMSMVAALKSHPFTDLSPYNITIEAWFEVMTKQRQFLELWLGKNHRELLEPLGGLPFFLEIGRLVASYALMFTKNSYCFTETSLAELLLEEKNILGKTGDELTCKLFELWLFDATMVDSLRYLMTPAYAIAPRSCAALKCTRTLFTLGGTEPFEKIESTLERFALYKAEARIAYETIIGDAC
jgi:HD-like signal output (HDOD) protein